jgi:hypothetical protein
MTHPRARKPAKAAPTSPKVDVVATVRLDAYGIIERAIETGVLRGWNRAHKHTDKPAAATVQDEVQRAVMAELCEVLRFGEGDER